MLAALRTFVASSLRSAQTPTAAAARSMSHAPSPLPGFVYKIYDGTDPRYTTFQTPLAEDFAFADTALDAKDGFIHLSTAEQLPRTLSRFFQDVDKILLVRMSYERLSTWKRLQWDPTSHGEAFAHLYATALTGDMVDVDGVRFVDRPATEKGWPAATTRLREEGWLRD